MNKKIPEDLFLFTILKIKFRNTPAEWKGKLLLQYFYVVYGIFIPFIETAQNRNIFIAINIMTYLLLQYFCMDCEGYTVNTALFHDLLLIQSTCVTNYNQIQCKSPIIFTRTLFSAD